MARPAPVALHHTCFVVRDLEATAQRLSDALSIGPWNIWTIREAKTELLRQGREMIQEASAGDVFDFAYFSFPEIGSAVEVLFLDATKLPQPEAVIRPTT